VETCQRCVDVMAFIVVALPVIVKAAHAAGYQVPILTALATWIASRPKVNR